MGVHPVPRERDEDRYARQLLATRQCPVCGQKLRQGLCATANCPRNPVVVATIAAGGAWPTPPPAPAEPLPAHEHSGFGGWPSADAVLPPELSEFRTAALFQDPSAFMVQQAQEAQAAAAPAATAPQSWQPFPPGETGSDAAAPPAYGPPPGLEGFRTAALFEAPPAPPVSPWADPAAGQPYAQNGYDEPCAHNGNGPPAPAGGEYGAYPAGYPAGYPAHASPGYPGYGAPAPAPQRGRGKRAGLITGAAALALVVGAVSVFTFGNVHIGFLSPATHAAGPAPVAFPVMWDARVQPLVNFVQQDRGLTYKHPVAVSFLSGSAFLVALNKDNGGPSGSGPPGTDAQQTALDRALGLIPSGVDLNAAETQLGDAGVLAFYSYVTKSIDIRGSTMSVALDVTLAHELTHALQDQYYNLARVDSMPQAQQNAFQTLYEGDAVRVQNDYVASLSAADRATYQAESNAQDNASSAGMASVPEALQTLASAPYVLGPEFVSALLEENGNAAVNTAFQTPPVDEQQIFNPWAYIGDQAPTEVAKPAVPKGAKVFESDAMGAASWYMTLTQRLDPALSLRAADAWDGDTYVAYTQGGKTCFADNLYGSSAQSAASLDAVFTQWVAAAPAGTASVSLSPTGILLVTACDPGTAANAAPVATAAGALILPVARTEFALSLIKVGLSAAQAVCAGTNLVVNYSETQLADTNAADFTSPAALAKIQKTVILPCLVPGGGAA